MPTGILVLLIIPIMLVPRRWTAAVSWTRGAATACCATDTLRRVAASHERCRRHRRVSELVQGGKQHEQVPGGGSWSAAIGLLAALSVVGPGSRHKIPQRFCGELTPSRLG